MKFKEINESQIIHHIQEVITCVLTCSCTQINSSQLGHDILHFIILTLFPQINVDDVILLIIE